MGALPFRIYQDIRNLSRLFMPQRLDRVGQGGPDRLIAHRQERDSQRDEPGSAFEDNSTNVEISWFLHDSL